VAAVRGTQAAIDANGWRNGAAQELHDDERTTEPVNEGALQRFATSRQQNVKPCFGDVVLQEIAKSRF
jgi:hypothetical protein